MPSTRGIWSLIVGIEGVCTYIYICICIYIYRVDGASR